MCARHQRTDGFKASAVGFFVISPMHAALREDKSYRCAATSASAVFCRERALTKNFSISALSSGSRYRDDRSSTSIKCGNNSSLSTSPVYTNRSSRLIHRDLHRLSVDVLAPGALEQRAHAPSTPPHRPRRTLDDEIELLFIVTLWKGHSILEALRLGERRSTIPTRKINKPVAGTVVCSDSSQPHRCDPVKVRCA